MNRLVSNKPLTKRQRNRVRRAPKAFVPRMYSGWGGEKAVRLTKRKRTARRRLAPNQRGQTSVAAAYATAQKTGQATIYRNGQISTRIVHRELIASITGSAAFAVAAAFPLNPGMPNSFPWLSNEAAGWERYRFNSLHFKYFTRTGSNIPGSFMMAPDYDASDAPPASEVAASAYEDTAEDAPWKDICCILKTSEMHGDMKEKYIRSGSLAANQDIKTYDAGNLFACTVDGTAVPWGKLWVEYDVTLFTPQTPVGGFQASGTLISAGGTITPTTPFGAAPLATGPVILTPIIGNPSQFTISGVQVGQELELVTVISGTVITALAHTIISGVNAKTNAFDGFPAAATTGAIVTTYNISAPIPIIELDITATTITRTIVTAVILSPSATF